MPPRIPPDYVERLQKAVSLVEEGWTQTEAAKAVGVSQGRLSEYLNGLWRPCDEQGGLSLTRFKLECCKIIYKAYKGAPQRGRVNAKFPCKVVFLDDLHIPFVDTEVIRQVVERERGADYLITFEVANFDAFSRFDQTYLDDPSTEQSMAAEFLTMLSQHFGQVICGKSNHMERPEKGIVRNLRPEQQEYVLKNLKTVYDEIKKAGIKHIASPLIQVGDAVFGHFDRCLATPGATAQRMLNKIRSSGEVFGITTNPTACFTGHTHRMAQVPIEGGRGYLFEVPCSTHVQPYAMNLGKGGRVANYAMSCGYAVAYFDNKGRIDLTESRVVHLKWSDIPEGVRR